MARRKSSGSGGGISLFPFLDIIASVIGILTLMIKVVSDIKALEQTKDKAGIEVALEHQQVQREIQERTKQREEMKEQLAQHGSAVVELNELEDRRVVLRRELDAAKAPEDGDATLQRRLEALIEQIAALKKERPPLDGKIRELTAELEDRKLDPNAKPPPVVVQPRGTGAGAATKLFFVECEAAGVVVRHPDGRKIPVSTAAIPTEPALSDFYNQARAEKDSMVLFLIRTDGNATFHIAAGMAEHQFRLNIGKLPVPNKGEIDLSRFTQ